MKKRCSSRISSDAVKHDGNGGGGGSGGSSANGNSMELENDNDISLLQRPLRTARTGFEEARRAFEDGTNEVRRLLTQECSLIYECYVCRNMFRSLANFISHKRVFCCINASEVTHQNGGYTDQATRMILRNNSNDNLNPSMQDIEHMLRSRSTGCSPVPREARPIRGSIRDLSGVIERLRREKASAMNMNMQSPVLQLEAVPTSSNAVYQTIKQEESDSIKTEVNEVHNMLNNTHAIVAPDGTVKTGPPSASNEESGENVDDETETNILCEICNLTFQTNKTLEVHIQKHHSSSAFVFQCPACSLTFLQAAAVIRHLSKDHNKPTRRIRMMRNNILKRRMQQGDVQPKGTTSRELKRLQLSDEAGKNGIDLSNEIESSNGGGGCGSGSGGGGGGGGGSSEHKKIMSLCIYCEKSFERRAALSTHLLNCSAKQEALAKPAPSIKQTKPKIKDYSDRPTDNMVDLPIAANDEQSMEQCADTDSHQLNEMFEDLAEPKGAFTTGLQTVSLDKLQLPESDSVSEDGTHSGDDDNEPATDDSKPTTDGGIDGASKAKKKRMVPVEKQLRCRCKICNKQFNALGNLRRHISMFHYRARRFGCTLCDYRAFRRYDIVNHLGFSHKIEGDREKLTEQYVSTHECTYSRDDVDGDIVLLDQEMPKAASDPEEKVMPEPKTPKTYQRCSKRVKTIDTSAAAAAATTTAVKETSIEPPAIPSTIDSAQKSSLCLEKPEEPEENPLPNDKLQPEPPQKEEKKRGGPNLRSRTSTSTESNGGDSKSSSKPTSAEKRSTRKRVKAVNKDFVYDLMGFKGNHQEGNTKVRRENGNSATNIVTTVGGGGSVASAPADTERVQWEAFVSDEKKSKIQGSTYRVMLELISQGRAVSATLPDLPVERPKYRPPFMSYFTPSPAKNVVETSPSTSESFFEKIAKRTAAAGKDTTAISNLWHKVNSAIAQDKLEPQCAAVAETPPLPTPPTPQLPPPPPPSSSSSLPSTPTANGNREDNTTMETPSTSQILTSPCKLQSPTIIADQHEPASTSTSSPQSSTPPPTPLPPFPTPPSPASQSQLPLALQTSATSSFPALPKPPSVLTATTTGGTIQFTLDSLLRAALQN